MLCLAVEEVGAFEPGRKIVLIVARVNIYCPLLSRSTVLYTFKSPIEEGTKSGAANGNGQESALVLRHSKANFPRNFSHPKVRNCHLCTLTFYLHYRYGSLEFL